MNSGSVRVNGGVYINNDGIETFLKNIKDISDSFDNIQKRIKKVKNSLENDFDGITPTIIDYAQTCVDLSDKLKKNADYIHTKSGRIVKIAEDAELKSLAEFDALEAIKQRIASLLASVGSFASLSYDLGEIKSFIGDFLGGGSGNSKNDDIDDIDDVGASFLSAVLPVFTKDGIIGQLMEMYENSDESIFKGPIEKIDSTEFGAPGVTAGVKAIERLYKLDNYETIEGKIASVILPTAGAFGSTWAMADVLDPYSLSGMIQSAKDITAGFKNKTAVSSLKSAGINAKNSVVNGLKQDIGGTCGAICVVAAGIDFTFNAIDNTKEYGTYAEQVAATAYDNFESVPFVGFLPTVLEVFGCKDKFVNSVANSKVGEALNKHNEYWSDGMDIICDWTNDKVNSLKNFGHKAKENINEFGNSIKTDANEVKETVGYIFSGDWAADLIEKGGHAIEDSLF